jgi:uncharacterized RDD family membrane protein YckC
VTYAGFWKRFFAFLIDLVILLVPYSGVIYLLTLTDQESVWGLITIWLLLVYLLFGLLYFPIFEFRAWQATPGKRLLQIYVTDLDGRRISFARATGRYFSKNLSSLILGIGYLMAGFTEKKQALHDMIASTVVVDGKPDNMNPAIGSGFAEFERTIVTSNQSSGRLGHWILAGFDSNGHVVRLSFDAEDPRLFDDGLILGRDSHSCDLHITDQSISRRHAKIFINNGDIWIEDLGSTNGIFINGKKIRANQSAPFNSSSTLAIGGIELTLGKG